MDLFYNVAWTIWFSNLNNCISIREKVIVDCNDPHFWYKNGHVKKVKGCRHVTMLISLQGHIFLHDSSALFSFKGNKDYLLFSFKKFVNYGKNWCGCLCAVLRTKTCWWIEGRESTIIVQTFFRISFHRFCCGGSNLQLVCSFQCLFDYGFKVDKLDIKSQF